MALAWRGLMWLALLAPFFYLSYGFANWVTGLREGVPAVVFGWERAIPFIAWSIVPYWSTNLFYALSFFISTTREELDAHARQLFSAQVLCIAGFLLFPLRASFDRPEIHGAPAWLFQALLSFDKPFNQAPSLHVALTAILWARYSAHFRGPALWLVRASMIAAALSTLTTFQHHFIDLPTGLLVGLIVMAERVTAIYATASLLLAAAALRIGGFAYLALWPAVALGFVAVVYTLRKPEWFSKRSPIARAILAPHWAGVWVHARLRTRGHEMAHEIADGVWIGRAMSRRERDALGIRSIVDVAAELPVDRRGAEYRFIPMLDLAEPTAGQLDAAVRAIAQFENARPTLVHCALGYSRSAKSVIAWLDASGRAESRAAAAAMVRSRRPQVVLE
jgi:protein-tyrosine phosphatase